MDYKAWSAEYWEEASRIKKWMEHVRKERSEPKEEMARKRRLTILYAMYLDCVHTAKHLERRAQLEGRI